MQRWGGSVYRDNIIYLHVLEETQEIILPGLNLGVISAETLTGGELGFKIHNGKWVFDLADCTNEGHIILKLITDGLVDEITAGRQYEGSITLGARASGSSTLAPAFAADSRYDTFWAPGINDKDKWLETDLNGLKAICRAELHIKLDDVRYGKKTPFDIYYEDDKGMWQKLLSSQIFGELWAQRFDIVMARKVKIFIDAPGIRFFGLYSK